MACLILLTFNVILINHYITDLKKTQEEVATNIEERLSAKYARTLALINLINYNIVNIGLDNKADLAGYFKVLQTYLKRDYFSIVSMGVAGIDGKLLYTTIPCLDQTKCSVAHRDYFKRAIQAPDNEYLGDIILANLLTNEKAIPLSKAIIINGQVKGVTAIGINIYKFLEVLGLPKLFSVTPQQHVNPTQAKEWSLLTNILKLRSTNKVIHGIAYEIKVRDPSGVVKNLLGNLIPWNLLMVSLYLIWYYSQWIKGKLATLLLKLSQNSKSFDLDVNTNFTDHNITQAFDYITKVLYKAAFRIKDYKQSIYNLESIIGGLVDDIRVNEEELNHLNHEIRNLIQDKSIKLNKEYISVLTEFTKNSHENNVTFKEQVILIKQTLMFIREEKIEMDVAKTVSKLKDFIITTSFAEDTSIMVFEKPMKMLLKQISEYFAIMCNEETQALDIDTKERDLVLIFKGTEKSEFQKSSEDYHRAVSKLYKIKLLAQLNSFSTRIWDSEDEQFIELSFTLTSKRAEFLDQLIPAKLVEVKV